MCKLYEVINWFFNKELVGGVFLDMGVYVFVFVRYFFMSQLNEIFSMVKLIDIGVDEQLGMFLKNVDNEMVVILLIMRVKMLKRGVVVGENGFIIVDDFI